MHRVVEKLLAISALAATGCHNVCHTPVTHTRATFVELEEKAPQIAASTYAELGLKSGTRTPSRDECVAACGPSVTTCEVFVRFEGTEDHPYSSEGTLDCQFEGERTCHEDFDPLNLGSCPYGCGRMPAFAVVPRTDDDDPMRRYVSEMAALEALSVGAFAQLARDLSSCGIDRFRARIVAACTEERRHARHARRVLRAFGVPTPRAVRVRSLRRALFDVALHNAVEGCVHETFGAALVALQAERAHDRELRSFFRAIAADELGHAALSWDVHSALSARLSNAERARIHAAQRVALARLERSPTAHVRLRTSAGLPSRQERAAMVRAMRDSLPWVPA